MKVELLAVHKGYRLTASADEHGALHAANLIIEHDGHAPYRFPALDYFYDAQQALDYAAQWGRLWIDSQS